MPVIKDDAEEDATEDSTDDEADAKHCDIQILVPIRGGQLADYLPISVLGSHCKGENNVVAHESPIAHNNLHVLAEWLLIALVIVKHVIWLRSINTDVEESLAYADACLSGKHPEHHMLKVILRVIIRDE